MSIGRGDRRFFESPHVTVYLLIGANIVAYGLCLRYSGTTAIPADLLFRNGAMYSSATERGEYWRLIAYGFLHANLFHLATNMLCLALWGGHLEKRIGSFYFLLIYLSALILGAVVGKFTHAGPYLTVGASGAISGILGALLCLWILAKVDLTANFFVINIGLNIALAFSASRIDWGAHLGGFAAGVTACALLDLVEKANALVLRCKFPEFVKVNCFILAIVPAVLFWGRAPVAPMLTPDGWLPLAIYAVACLAVIKSIDLALSMKHGLAIVVAGLSVANAAMVFFAGSAIASAPGSRCVSPHFSATTQIERLLDAACGNVNLALVVVAACALVLTLLLYSQELDRGLKDVGFVGATLRAERKRRRGL